MRESEGLTVDLLCSAATARAKAIRSSTKTTAKTSLEAIFLENPTKPPQSQSLYKGYEEKIINNVGT